MDFKFFEVLSKKDGQLFLKQFLKESGQGFESMISEINKDKAIVDYSTESIITVTMWFKSRIKIVPQKIDQSLPKWLKNDETYLKGLYLFDENSNILTLRLAYYFAECLNRKHKNLIWTVGNNKTALSNMPVLSGFKYKKELAPILVCENILKKLIEGEKENVIKTCIEIWESYL